MEIDMINKENYETLIITLIPLKPDRQSNNPSFMHKMHIYIVKLH